MAAPKAKHKEILDGWLAALQRIDHDVTDLASNRQIWREIIEALNDGADRIPQHGFVGRWLTEMYVTTQSVGVRRQADSDKGAHTIASLLAAMKRNPAVITRAGYHSLCGVSDEHHAAVADAVFDKWAGVGGDSLSTNLVEEREQQLQQTVSVVRTFVSRRLAHHDRRGEFEIPTFGELDRALDELGELLIDLQLLLRCVGRSTVEPTIVNPWKRAFSVAWMPIDEGTR